jgi:hypothetical protein
MIRIIVDFSQVTVNGTLENLKENWSTIEIPDEIREKFFADKNATGPPLSLLLYLLLIFEI